MATRLRSGMRLERIKSTVVTALLFNRDFSQSYIKANIYHQLQRNLLSNLSLGRQSSHNDRRGNDENEKYFVTHRDAAA